MSEASEKASPQNWILLHPAYQQMKDLEVGDSAQVHAAFLVYMDLAEVRQWKEVTCVKIPELQAVLLEGREKEGAPIQTVLPLPVHRSLCHKSIRHVLDRGFPMLLCAVASDSTLVYQRMTDGLVTPDPPVGPFQDVGRRHHRKRRQKN
ncbi:tRNA-splicing endonuclease subunit Sen15 [Seriola lalandi dorsalis]|nr:tRNA-splicing endonuclease subunit Sen15 isoform X1 [Seriola dumerili]XP_023270529.1 tRNA-splicing endonuclease subunit Sen15 [Seriola lalandi dorsalis]XP_056246991.1 tRNA-splicing endonuclease subunit Sen15 [Seriola aureovittata]